MVYTLHLTEDKNSAMTDYLLTTIPPPLTNILQSLPSYVDRPNSVQYLLPLNLQPKYNFIQRSCYNQYALGMTTPKYAVRLKVN